jgi:hypothetical protein
MSGGAFFPQWGLISYDATSPFDRLHRWIYCGLPRGSSKKAPLKPPEKNQKSLKNAIRPNLFVRLETQSSKYVQYSSGCTSAPSSTLNRISIFEKTSERTATERMKIKVRGHKGPALTD